MLVPPTQVFLAFSFIVSSSALCLSRHSNRFNIKSDQRKALIRCMTATSATNDLILEVIHRKKYEVQKLQEKHKDAADSVKLRLGYAAEESSFRLTRALRKYKLGDERPMTVLADLKRISPTSRALPRTVSAFTDAGQRTEELLKLGVTATMVNTDEMGWGGNMDDLTSTVSKLKEMEKRPGEEGEMAAGAALVMKDLIIDPIQIAVALDQGAHGVVLLANVVGQALEELMDAATIMGTEAIVEVHTPEEVKYAVELGASIIMVNNWDRATGSWHPKQALAVRRYIPDHIVTIATGGIASSDQTRQLADVGYDCVAMGRALAVHPQPGRLVRNIRAHRAPPSIPGWNGPRDD